MRRALFHAERALGATTPNPMVGAVVVDREGVIVGVGHHTRAGQPHAEVVALDEAGERARGGTLYVTLEPCCHTGRTGPCTARIEAAGIARVVAAIVDPFPAVAGGGVRVLMERGISVDLGIEADRARRLNAAYLSVLEWGRPLVVAKAATSRDGRIAAQPGRPTALSGAAAQRRCQRLRGQVDAIAVGSGTVLADDPRLTARDLVRERPLRRIVFDRRLRTPLTARVLAPGAPDDVIIVTSPARLHDAPARVAALEDAGARVVPAGSLDEALRGFAAQGIHSLLVEGGAELHRAFWEAGLIDRLHMIVTPHRLGPEGVPLFGGWPVPWARLRERRASACGDDVWMEADVHWDR